ncbi:MAG: polyprenyl synthetase family protein [Bacteroidales bacterium]|nr:polyprenyl synthetase family protein [Bacteroidales bacterium]
MKTIEQLQQTINSEIATISYPSTPAELYQPIQYILEGNGKRLRPLLLLLAHQLYNEDISPAIKPALGIEIFHNFTLIHDDIMDKSPMRRNKPTVHLKWNENIALLSGDAMMILSFQFFLDLPKHIQNKVLELFTKTALEVCEGQQYDMNYEQKPYISLDEYLQMIRLKTAVLIACSLSMGAIIANAPKTEIQHLYDAGINLGLAFQLQDDLLDVYGDPAIFGKNIGNDIITKKKTFLYVSAYQFSDIEYKQKLDYFFDHNNIDAQTKINEIKQIYSHLKLETYTQQQIQKYIQSSINHIQQLNAQSKAKELLLNFISQLLHRLK